MRKKILATRAASLSLALVLAGVLAACGQGGDAGQAANTPANHEPASHALTSLAAPTPSPASSALAPRRNAETVDQGPAVSRQAKQTASQAPAATRQVQAAARQARTDPDAQFAKVVAVQPIEHTTTASTPRQVCKDEQVQVPVTHQDNHQIAGDVIGGLLGALAGHQVGGGKGKTLATIAGAAGGAFAGHEVQKHHQNNNATQTVTKNVCHTVANQTSHTTTVGYDVTYILNGETGHVRMDHNPGVGMGLPVKDGVVAAGSRQKKGHYYK